MAKSTGSNAALYWVMGVIFVAMVIFVYLVVSDAPKTVPKINLSYFVDEQEIADSITKRLTQELASSNSFWLGVEPEKWEELDVVLKLKNNLEKQHAFKKVFIDSELSLSPEVSKALGMTDAVSIKDNLFGFGEQLAELEKSGTAYLVLTASIYSNSLLKDNPLHKLKDKFQLKPTTFSMAYFSTTPDDEGKILFKCDTEDHSGTRDWGCFALNKARAVRRKIDTKNAKPWMGLMDLSGETDYAVLLKKK